MKRGNVQPIIDRAAEIYHIPYLKVGYAGGSNGRGQILNFVTIVKQRGSKKIITAFPSSGS